MYKISSLAFFLSHLGLFLKKRIRYGFICGKAFVFKNSGKIFMEQKVVFRNFCSVLVESSAKLSIGNNVFFNNYCSINCCCEIEIGNDCLFGEGVKLYDHNHTYKNKGLVNKNPLRKAPIKIGKNTWVGSNAVILCGVTVGDNCVIGANSVIYKSLPKNSICFSDGTIKAFEERSK